MQYINTQTKVYPVSLAQIQAEHPLTMFPQPFAEAFGDYAPVANTEEPVHDPATHKLVQLPPAEVDGEWRQAWDVVALTPQELDDARRARVPASVTRRQARQALLLAGLLDSVQPAIEALADPVLRGMAQIEWDDSQAFERHRPLLVSLGHAIGLDDAGLDDLFTTAAGL